MAPSRLLVLDRRDTLVAQVRAIAGELWPTPTVVPWSVPGTVGDALTDQGPFDVLIAGPSLGTRNGLARLRVIREELPAMPIVLAFSKRPDASIREIVRSGAVDLVQLPADDADLLDAIERALSISLVVHDEPPPPRSPLIGPPPDEPLPVDGTAPPIDALPGHTPLVPTSKTDLPLDEAPEADAPPAVSPPSSAVRAPGRVITIAAAARGCGKTFLATNVAYFLAERSGGRVCIVDLDLHFGGVATALACEPAHTIADALYDADAGEIDLHTDLPLYTGSHASGIEVLAAPVDPADADQIRPHDITDILEATRRHFDWVVVDTPPTLSERVLAAFDVSDEVYAMATLDIDALRELRVFLSTLQRLGVADDNVRLVLNKADPAASVNVEEITRLFPRGFEAVLPIADEVGQSIDDGMAVLAEAPSSEVSQLLAGGLARLLPFADRPASADAAAQKASKRRRLSLRR